MTAPPSEARHPVDAASAVLAASYLFALNYLIVNVMPLVVGAVADDHGIAVRQLGYLSATFVAASTVAAMSAPAWVRRVDWRVFTLVAVTLAIIALFAGALAQGLAQLFLLFAVLGLLKGLVGAPSFASLGDTRDPDRSYGVSVIFQCVTTAVAAAPLASFVIPRFGSKGVFVVLAVVLSSGLIACAWLPRRGRMPVVASATSAGTSAPIVVASAALLGLVALGLFSAGVSSYFNFVERIGVARGVSKDLIGLTLSLQAFCSLGTAALVAWLGNRLPTLLYVAVATLILLIAFAVLLNGASAAFVVANLLFAFGWGLATPAYWAQVRKLDSSGRIFVAAPAAAGVASVLASMSAGLVAERAGYDGLVVYSGGLMIVGVLVAAFALQAGRRVTSVSAGVPVLGE